MTSPQLGLLLTNLVVYCSLTALAFELVSHFVEAIDANRGPRLGPVWV